MKKNFLHFLLVTLMVLVGGSAWAGDKTVVKYTFDDAISPALTAGNRVSFDYDKTSVITSTNFLNAWNNANGDPGATTVSLGAADLSGETWTLSFEWAACGGCNSKADHTTLKAGDTNLFDLTGNSNWNTTVTLTYAGSDGTQTLPVPGCNKSYRFTAGTGNQYNTADYWHHIVVTGSADGVKLTITNSSTGAAIVENVVLSETNVNPTSLIVEPCCGGAIGIDELSLSYAVEGEVIQTPVANYIAVEGISRTVAATCDTEGAVLYSSTDGENWTQEAYVTVSESGKIYFKAVKGASESDVLEFDVKAGEAITLMNPTIVRSDNTTVTITADQTSLLLSPTAIIYYTYGAESGSFTGSITLEVAEDAIITAYAEAEGYTTSATSELAVALFPEYVNQTENAATVIRGWETNAFSEETITASNRTYAALLLDDVRWGENIYFQTDGAWGFRASGNWYINSDTLESWVLMPNMKKGDIIVVNVTYPASSTVNATYSKYSFDTQQAYVVTEDGNVELAFKKINASTMDYLYGIYAYTPIIDPAIPVNFVYTPQGRFQITSKNLNANSSFQNFDGWTVVSEEGKSLEDKFSINANGYAEGVNSVVSVDETEGEGMYFKFEPSDPDLTYLVSFKMKGAALDNVRTRIPSDGRQTQANLVKVAGNETGYYTYPYTEDEMIVNTAEELTEDWQTFNYAIQGEGVSRTWFISFTTMSPSIEIADLQIKTARQVADLRQRDAMVEKLNAYKNCYEWDASLLDDFAIIAAINELNAIDDLSSQDELDELLGAANEIIDEFVKANMDDYLAVNSDNYLGINTTGRNIQKVNSFGDWIAMPTGRGFWTRDSNPELGHFATDSWNYGSVDAPMGIYMQKTLEPGSYVFSIEGNAALREESTSDSWTVNEGWNPAYGVAYIVKTEEGMEPDTVVAVVKDLEPVDFTPFIVPVQIAEQGTYEIGFKAYCKDAYKRLRYGSVVYVKDASLWAKNGNKYNQKQLAYEANVREQIEAARAQLDMAINYLADESYFWNKAFLQSYVDEILPMVEAYEALDQDAIIATYDDYYENTTQYESGLLQYEVCQTAVLPLVYAIRDFLSANRVLKSLQMAIDEAQATMALKIYSAATGKGDLRGAIATAKDVQTQMRGSDYSGENVDYVNNAIAELNEAVEYFKTTIPESALLTLADIDFENDAVLNEETGLYSINGAVGLMEFSNFSLDGLSSAAFEKGFWDNGEQLWKGFLRVGNGTGTVLLDAMPESVAEMGNSILKISCDFYLQGLTGRSIGFYLNNEAGENICGIYHNFYNGTTTENTFNVDMGYAWAKSGGTYNNASPAGAEYPTSNPLQKTNFEVIMDFCTMTMYCTISSPNGITTSEPVEFADIPKMFVLQCDYNYETRRCWFDNLKIQKYLVVEPIIEPEFANGDVNHDEAVDVTDAVLIIDEILMKNPSNFDAALADVNHDNTIDVTDVVLVIDKILGKIELSRGATRAEKDLSAYTAFQMDLTIPVGYVLEGVELTDMAKKSHSLAYNMLADGRCRVVVFSMDNEALPGAWDEVIRLNLRGQGDAFVNVDRAMFVTVGGERHELLLNGTTSIAQLSTLNSQFSIVYDLQGRKVEKTAKGVYVIDGKKVVIK